MRDRKWYRWTSARATEESRETHTPCATKFDRAGRRGAPHREFHLAPPRNLQRHPNPRGVDHSSRAPIPRNPPEAALAVAMLRAAESMAKIARPRFAARCQ